MPEQVLVERDFGRVLCSVTKFYHGGLLVDLTAMPRLRGLLHVCLVLILKCIVPTYSTDTVNYYGIPLLHRDDKNTCILRAF